MFNRRQIIASAGAAAGFAMLGGTQSLAETVSLGFENGDRQLVTYPGKRPLLGLSARPPQLETPFAVFNESLLTPNDAFFVRYHLADIPTEIDPETFRLAVGGKVETSLSLSLSDLKSQFDTVDLVAVHQCSGNSRGFTMPRVAGGQAGNGLMAVGIVCCKNWLMRLRVWGLGSKVRVSAVTSSPPTSWATLTACSPKMGKP